MKKSEKLCKIVYMVEGKPKECGGEIKAGGVPQPYRLGAPQPALFKFRSCTKCNVVYDS